MADAPALDADAIRAALRAPVDAPPLGTLARHARGVVIAIDDITRPTKTATVVRLLVEELNAAGVNDDGIAVLIASGAHKRATPEDIERKVGRDLAARVRVVGHDPHGALVDTGVTLGGVPVRVNPLFAAADLRIGVSGVIPHPFAAFSGGGKIVIPGLCDLDVLARTHKFALMGFGGGAKLEGNRFRGEMEAAVRRIGLQWTVGVALNSARDAAFVAAGDLVSAHRLAAAEASRIGATAPPPRPLDALILNAYPKDSELLQIEAALVALRSGMLGWLSPGAPVVLCGACPDGLGYHGLFGPGGRLFRTPSVKTFLERRPLVVHAPTVSDSDVRLAFWDGYPSCPTWASVVETLAPLLPARPVVGVVPCGPLQLASGSLHAGSGPARRESPA